MLNLAAYGLVIGHEMTHGFDNSGRLYDAIGQERDWWTASDKAEFNARSQCFIDQYSSFKLFNQSMDGKNTLGENIAESVAHAKRTRTSSHGQRARAARIDRGRVADLAHVRTLREGGGRRLADWSLLTHSRRLHSPVAVCCRRRRVAAVRFSNGGLGLAWRSYKNLAKDPATNITRQLLDGLTNDQLFFVRKITNTTMNACAR